MATFKVTIRAKRLNPYILWRFDFFNSDSLLDAFEFLYANSVEDSTENTLYRTENCYSCVLKTTKDIADSLHVFSCGSCEKYKIAQLEEYARPILKGKIITEIGSKITKNA